MTTTGPRGNTQHNLITVVIPTYHRPDYLRAAVRAILDQEMPDNWEMETIIAVSDKDSSDDIDAAEELAQDDRVRFIVADRPGPAAARNAAIRASHGQAVAFTDDDCLAQPHWLRRSIEALAEADLVQGRTTPAGLTPPMSYSLSVDPPSWLWETCNLVVCRDAIDRAGLFDEEWNPTGRIQDAWGEDIEWGWRLIRSGARPAFEPDARVVHAVIEQDLLGMMRRDLRIRHAQKMIDAVPESQRHFYLNHFLNERHAVLTGILAGVLLGAGVWLRGRKILAVGLWTVAFGAWSYPMRAHFRGVPTHLSKNLYWIASNDLRELRGHPPLIAQEPRFLGVLASRRQGVVAGSIGLAIGSVLAARSGRRWSSRLAAITAIVAWAAPIRQRAGPLAPVVTNLGIQAIQESVQFFPLLLESVRRRRILL